MRCKVLAFGTLGVLAVGCAPPSTTRVCSPSVSWSSPAFTCTYPGGKPAEPDPEPAPPEPPPPPPPVELIEISDRVQFETGKSVLLKESEELLDREVVAVLKAHPEIKLVEIGGHTDARSDDDFNLSLSQARAEAVKKYLVKKGVEAERLTTQGFGETQPIGDNSTDEGMAQNRRVEFKVLKREPPPDVAVDPATGQPVAAPAE
jgi:outer membrane protein OmpA-like peptidoglycan-associated protein